MWLFLGGEEVGHSLLCNYKEQFLLIRSFGLNCILVFILSPLHSASLESGSHSPFPIQIDLYGPVKVNPGE